jgi:hypothetical protein
MSEDREKVRADVRRFVLENDGVTAAQICAAFPQYGDRDIDRALQHLRRSSQIELGGKRKWTKPHA